MNSVALGWFFHYLQYALILGSIMTVGKLWLSGLYRRYLIFFLYFIYRIPNSIWPVFIDVHSRTYFKIWAVTSVLALILYVLTVAELYRLVFEKYRGLQTVGRWAIYLSIAISVAISIVSLTAQFGATTSTQGKTLKLILGAESTLETGLTVFIVLLLAVLSRYPIRLSPNVRLHARVFSIFFLASSVATVLWSLFGVKVPAINLIVPGVHACCMAAWIVFLGKQGDEMNQAVHRIATEHEKRLLHQLELLNSTMLRVSRQRAR